MLTITIIFALLVAIWGFSDTIVTIAKRSLTHVKPRSSPVHARSSGSRAGGTRPIAH
ncbi:MAG: hypothetical protein WKF48_08795 [Solirubrobacteraceae bacterium]